MADAELEPRSEPAGGSQRERATQLIHGFANAAVAAQQASTLPAIFRIARERLASLGLSVYFAERREGGFVFFEAEGIFPGIAEEIARRHGPVLAPELAPIQQAILTSPHGVLVDNLRAITAQILNRPLAEIDLPAGLAAVGAAIYVGGAIEFTVTAAGLELDRSIASAFSLFARQLGFAIETSRRLEELARKNRELTILNHVARTAATLGSGRALEEALEWLARALGIEGVALFRSEGAELVLAVHAGMPEAWVAGVARVAVRAQAPWSEAARGKEPRCFSLRGEGDAVALPLHTGEELQGVLVASRSSSRLTADELRLLENVGAQLAVSLQSELLFQQTQRRVRELSLLLELGQAVAGTLDQREILRAGVRVATRVLRCSAAYVFVPDEEQTSLACAASDDPLQTAALEVRLPLSRPSLSALAFRTRKAQVSSDSPHDERIAPELNALFGCRSTLAVPLSSHERALGVLLLIERSSERSFDEQDMRLAVHAAQLLAASVENAALYAEQHRRAEEMTRLNDAARSIAGALELEPLLAQAAETLRKILDASHCLIYLLDAGGRTLEIRTPPPDFPGLAGRRLSLDLPSAAAAAVRERKAMQYRDAADSPFVSRELAELLGAQSVLAVPLIARGEPVGTVVLSDRRKERSFSPAEIERATTVAAQIAMAIITARLIEDLRRSYSDLKKAQAETVDRERLAVLGELSASIAHEVRNPLGVIFNAVASLKRMLRQEGNVGLLLGIIGEEADRLNRMVADLLDYSRPYQPALQPVPLVPLVEDALRSAHTQAGRGPGASLSSSDEGLRVEVRIPKELTLRADSRLLRQALINLFLNAFQAMPKGGRLEVLAERADGPRGPGARLRIRDDGPGIPEPVRARVFHPFFTTKATGTGLGLAVVKRILEGHGGRIALVGGEEIGAEFELWLPVEE